MGYISSATTITLDSHLTQKGREVILSGISNNITKFTLGDSDTNYLVTTRNSSGKVPDVTGDHIGCIFSVARNVDIKNKISLSGFTIQTTKELRFINNNNSFNILNVEINLGNYCSYLDNQSTTTTFNSNLKSPIIDFYEFIRIEEIDNNGNTIGSEFDNISVEFKSAQDYNVFTKIQNSYLTYQTKILTTNRYKNNNFNNLVDSPLKILFSSLNSNINSYFGAGPGGAVLFGREYGYSVVNIDKPNIAITTGMIGLNLGFKNFYKPEEIEGNNITLSSKFKLVPSVRITNPFNPSQKEVFVTKFEGTFNDSTGSHDHIKRFGNEIIEKEIELMKQTMQWLVNSGLGVNSTNVDYVSLGMLFKSQQITSKMGELNITFKMDRNTNNWNQNGDFITIL